MVKIGADYASSGQFTIDFADIGILSVDGTVRPLYDASPTSPAYPADGTISGANVSVTNSGGDSSSTHYFLADRLGTTQMELSSAGWPVWSGQFTPFGQEIVNGATLMPGAADGTSMRFKFTGKERDTESGLDYFGSTYYGSSMGRFMSPD